MAPKAKTGILIHTDPERVERLDSHVAQLKAENPKASRNGTINRAIDELLDREAPVAKERET